MTEQERQREAAARLDRQKEERQRSEDSRRQEEERRRQEQRQQDERRPRERQDRETSQREEADHREQPAERSKTRAARTEQGRDQVEIDYEYSMKLLHEENERFKAAQEQDGETKQDSPAVERLKEKMEKVKEQARAQDKTKSHGMEHDRG